MAPLREVKRAAWTSVLRHFSGPARRRALRAVLLAPFVAWLAATSCSDPLGHSGRRSSFVAQLQIRASVAGTPASTLVITVSASDIDPPLVFNIEQVDGVATGTIVVPVGTDRMLLVRAFDATGAATHEGSREVDVRAGGNPSVSITLLPLVGDQPIDVRVGNYVVRVTPEEGLIAEGETIALSADVTDLDGNPVEVDPDDVRWASFDTRLATVDTRGTVTGGSQGAVQVIASYGGAAGASRITVGQGLATAGDIGRCFRSDDEATAAIVDTLRGLVLSLGDHAYERGTHKNFKECYDPSWGAFKTRTRPVPGNHDYDTTDAVGYFTYFDQQLAPFGASARDPGKAYYSYDLGSWHIIALNSELPYYRTDGEAEMSAQVEWLRNDLAATSAKCVLAYWHRARYSSATHGNNAKMDPLWDELYAAGADLVLTAHDHTYERFAPQDDNSALDPDRGVRQFVVGTGGYSLYAFKDPPRPNSEVRIAEFGVLRIVLGTDSYNWRFIGAPSGAVRDSGSTRCH